MIFPIIGISIYTYLRTLIKSILVYLVLFSFSNSLAFDLKGIAKSVIGNIDEKNIPYLVNRKQYDKFCKHLFVDTKVNFAKLAYYKVFGEDDSFLEYLVNTPWLPLVIEDRLGSLFLSKIESRILTPKEYKIYYQILEQETNLIISNLKEILGNKVPINFKFYIYDSQERNAFSLPGGYILVSKRLIDDIKIAHMLKSRRREEKVRNVLRFILAHEISHNLKRHYTYHLQEMILNGIYDVDNFKDIQTIVKNAEFFASLSSSSLSVKKKQIEAFLENILFYLDKSVHIKRKSLLHLTDFEKEADACAIRILFVNRSYSDLEQIIKDVFDNKEEIEYLKLPSKNSTLKEIAIVKNTLDNISRILAFYLSSPIFVHPNYEDRKVLLMDVLSYWRKHHEH